MLSKESSVSISDYISSEVPWLFNFIKYAFYGIFITLDVNPYQALVLMIFMGVDTGLGLLKSKRLEINLEWMIFWWGILVKMIILLVPMLLALLGKGLGYNFKPLVDVAMKILICNEFVSCITNSISIKTKIHLRNKDFVSMLLFQLRSFGIRLAENLMNSIPKQNKES